MLLRRTYFATGGVAYFLRARPRVALFQLRNGVLIDAELKFRCKLRGTRSKLIAFGALASVS